VRKIVASSLSADFEFRGSHDLSVTIPSMSASGDSGIKCDVILVLNMKTIGLWAILACLVAPCYAQMLDAAQYRETLKGLDESGLRWQKQLRSLDVDKLKVTYAVGRNIEKARDTIIKTLVFMHNFVGQQRVGEALSIDISIDNTISDLDSPLDVLIDSLPSDEEGVYWARTLGPMAVELSEFQIPLRKHIDAFANKLQLKAEHCSK
jgi:hypothetical protein